MMTPAQYSILLVDDNPNNLAVLSDFLGDMGFEILVARDGESALQKVNYALPDLILLDIMMPGMDGFETCQELKSRPDTSKIPVIFMTALSESHNKVQGLSLGAVDYITKPFQQEEVLARVKLHLELHDLQRSLIDQNHQLKQEVASRQAAEAAVQSLNQELENRVAERTQELAQALEGLKQTQLQMVQGEKLAALGQLVAGVAHEINNPVNFIAGNVSHASHYTQNLLELLTQYQQALPEGTPEIQDLAAEMDLEFLRADLTKVMQSMKFGADRIREIVQSLCSFSRSDDSEAKAVDIHLGIDSTLMILNSRLKAKSDRDPIQVIKNYGDLPLVTCYPGQLNQVFMNLLANAIDALEEGIQQGKLAQTSPQICITTSITSDHQVQITIADTGPGIDAETQQQLFEPFFTTKPIGKGTGLGLSISQQVITETHQGTLKCCSQLGQGTEFVIQLPIAAPSNDRHAA
ncbi:MAG: response regulator [Leptolyngbya sp. SIOISBB]|nr:response regulator [Leptolyngbya sp. SIOISBB]